MSPGEDAVAPRARARRLLGRFGWPALFTALLVGVAAMGLVPTRTYLEKKHEIATAEARLAELSAANDKAQAQVDALRSDSEIERIAREQYGLAKPGEETYHVLPPPESPVQIPDAWPFDRMRQGLPTDGGARR